MPLYLKSIGFSVFLIGFLEGLMELVTGLGKGYFGQWSDRTGRRLPFVRLGYFLSAVAKPMLGLSAAVGWVFFARMLDRMGKSVRSASRDALLAQAASSQNRNRVFNFHRAGDTFGTVVGAALALAFLALFPGQYVALFFWVFVPAAVGLAFAFAVREKKTWSEPKARPRLWEYFGYWKHSRPQYRRLVTVLIFFALFNSSDVFLLLKVKELTGDDASTIQWFILFNVVYAVCTYPLGGLADKYGVQKVFVAGLFCYALTYGGIVFAQTHLTLALTFAAYGLFMAATEGGAKAWVSVYAPKADAGAAIGLYDSLHSVALMAASVWAGAVWHFAGPEWVFLPAAGAAVLAALVLIFGWTSKPGDETPSNV